MSATHSGGACPSVFWAIALMEGDVGTAMMSRVRPSQFMYQCALSFTSAYPALISFAADKMKVYAPDRIAGICRFIGSDREITFFERGLDGFSEIDRGADLLIDFLDDQPHLNACIVCPRIADHFKHRHAFRPVQLQFFSNLFVDLADRNPEIFSESNSFLRRHLAVGGRASVCIDCAAPHRGEQIPDTDKKPFQEKGLLSGGRPGLLGSRLQRVGLIRGEKPTQMRPAALSSYQERKRFCDGAGRELKPRGDGFLAIAFLVLAVPHEKSPGYVPK